MPVCVLGRGWAGAGGGGEDASANKCEEAPEVQDGEPACHALPAEHGAQRPHPLLSQGLHGTPEINLKPNTLGCLGLQHSHVVERGVQSPRLLPSPSIELPPGPLSVPATSSSQPPYPHSRVCMGQVPFAESVHLLSCHRLRPLPSSRDRQILPATLPSSPESPSPPNLTSRKGIP